MTPKFRPLAFRRLLIAAAGASLAFSAAPAVSAAEVLFWAGGGDTKTFKNDGIWVGFNNFNSWAPQTGSTGTNFFYSTANIKSFSDGDAVVFTKFANGTTVTIGGQTPVLATNSISYTPKSQITTSPSGYTDMYSNRSFSPLTVDSGASVKITGASLSGGSSGNPFIFVNGIQTASSTAAGALELQNINYFSGNVEISGSLTISNGRALGLTGSNNKTIVKSAGLMHGSLILTGGITTESETLEINGSGVSNGGALINSSGNNVYAGPVTLSGSEPIKIRVEAGSTLTISNSVTPSTTSATFSDLNISIGDSSSIIFSGGVDMGTAASIYFSSFSSTSTSAAATISGVSPLLIDKDLKIGGGVSLSLNSKINGHGLNPSLDYAAGGIILGDEYGAGYLTVGSGNLLKNISKFVVNNGSLVADLYNGTADLFIGTSGTVKFTSPDIIVSAQTIKNANYTNLNALDFSATTGTVALQNGFGYPSPGGTHFGSNAIIGSVSNVDGSESGGIVDGIITVEKNLGITYITGGSVTVRGDLYTIQTPTFANPAIYYSAIGIIDNTVGVPTTVVNVTGNAELNGIAGGTISVGGNLSVTGYSGYYGSFAGLIGSANNPTVNVGGDVDVDQIGVTTLMVGGNLMVNGIYGGTTTVTGKITDNLDGTVGADIFDGTLTLNGTGNLIDVMSGGTLNLNGASTTIAEYNDGAINLKTGSSITVLGGDILTGQFTGIGLVIQKSPDYVVLTGSINSSTPVVFKITALVEGISGGTVQFKEDSALRNMTGGTASIDAGKVLSVLGRQSAGVISGNGSLEFSVPTAGTYYTLSGNNTYTGGTDLRDGILCVGTNTALGSGTLTIQGGGLASASTTTNILNNHIEVVTDFILGDAANNGALTLAGTVNLNGSVRTITANSDVTISGIISNGGINKLGTGKLTLSGLNTFIGGITISEGTLAGTTDNLSGSFTIGANCSLELSQSTNGTFGGILSGGGILKKSGTGKVSLSGLNDYTGGTTVTGGTLSGSTANIRGNITTSGTGILEFNQSGTTPATFDGTFSGNGTVQKAGAATLTTTSNIVAGSVVVNEGTLVENGGIAAAVVVNAGGTLKGSGVITGSVTINGGVITIGNSPAIVNLIGGHTQNGGTFISEIGGTTPGNTLPGFHDQYNVTGGAFTITGAAKLQLDSWYSSGTTPFVPSRGDSFNIINASKGIVGAFSQLDNNVDSQQTLVFAQHSGAVYALGRAYGTSPQKFGDIWVGTAPANATQRSVYNAIYDASVTSGNSTTPSKFIDGTSADGRLAIALIKDTSNTAYKQSDFSAESYFGATDYALTITRSVTDAALNQPTFYKLKRWAVGADYNYASNKFHGGSSADFDRSLTGQTGFFTVNYSINDDATVGIFAGFNSGKTSTSTTGFDYKGELMGVTGKLHFNGRYPVDIKAALVNTSLSFDSRRSMLGISDAAALTNQKLKETSFALQADIETLRADRWMIFTNLGLSYGNATTDAFNENGSVLGLSVNGLSQKSTQASVGVSTKYYQSLKLSYDLSAKLEKDFGSSSTLMAKYRVSTGAMSDVNNPSSGQTAVALGGGLTYKPTASSLFTAGAELRGSSDYSSDVRLNLSYKRKF